MAVAAADAIIILIIEITSGIIRKSNVMSRRRRRSDFLHTISSNDRALLEPLNITEREREKKGKTKS